MAINDDNITNLLKTVLDAMPSLIFIVDDDVRIHEYNAAAAELLSGKTEAVLNRRGGEAFHCVHSTDVPEGCGCASFCNDCVIRNSVTEAFGGNRIVRRRTKMEITRQGETSTIYALITASPFQFDNKTLVLLAIEDISIISELQQMITMCSVCREIRDEKEAWHRVENYFKKQWDVDFSHGLCPKCFKIQMGELERKLPEDD